MSTQYDLPGFRRGKDWEEQGGEDLRVTFANVASGDGVATRTLSLGGGAKQPVKYIGGNPVGAISDSIYAIPVDQIRPDEPAFLLRSNYRPQEDKELPDLIASIRRSGGLLEPISVIWRQGEWQTVPDGTQRPLYRVRLGVRRWYALRKLAQDGEEFATMAQVIVLQDQATEGQQLLRALMQQEMSKPLTLREYADTVHRLVSEYGYTTQEVAEYLGEQQQDRMSRLNLAAQQSERIRAYMELDWFTLKHVDKLRNCLDKELRDQIATYVVQERHSAEKTARLVAMLCALPGQPPKFALLESADHRLRLVPLAGAGKDEADDLLHGQHYWERSAPLLATSTRILREAGEHPLSLRGGVKQPVVQVRQLMVAQTLQALLAEDSAELDAATLALALQADLEALTQAYTRLQRETVARKSKRNGLSIVEDQQAIEA